MRSSGVELPQKTRCTAMRQTSANCSHQTRASALASTGYPAAVFLAIECSAKQNSGGTNNFSRANNPPWALSSPSGRTAHPWSAAQHMCFASGVWRASDHIESCTLPSTHSIAPKCHGCGWAPPTRLQRGICAVRAVVRDSRTCEGRWLKHITSGVKHANGTFKRRLRAALRGLFTF